MRYDGGREFSEGLAAVCEKDKWGYVDTFAKERISPRFAEAQTFSQGLAAVKIEEKWGYINLSGDLVINPRFKHAGSFSEGLAAVQVDRQFGYVGPEGSIRIEPQFDDVREFHEGLATVGKTHRPFSGLDCHFIDTSGQKAFDLESYNHLDARFSEGLVGVRHGSGGFAYFDKTGAKKIELATFTGKDGKRSYSQFMKSGGRLQSGIAQVMLKPSYYQEIGEFRWDDMAYIDKEGEVVWRSPR